MIGQPAPLDARALGRLALVGAIAAAVIGASILAWPSGDPDSAPEADDLPELRQAIGSLASEARGEPTEPLNNGANDGGVALSGTGDGSSTIGGLGGLGELGGSGGSGGARFGNGRTGDAGTDFSSHGTMIPGGLGASGGSGDGGPNPGSGSASAANPANGLAGRPAAAGLSADDEEERRRLRERELLASDSPLTPAIGSLEDLVERGGAEGTAEMVEASPSATAPALATPFDATATPGTTVTAGTGIGSRGANSGLGLGGTTATAGAASPFGSSSGGFGGLGGSGDLGDVGSPSAGSAWLGRAGGAPPAGRGALGGRSVLGTGSAGAAWPVQTGPFQGWAPPKGGRSLLSRGSVIPAVLSSPIDSDIPGLARATVSRDVFDTLTTSRLLIPRGSWLVGEYASFSPAGQARLAVGWTDLILPDGSRVDVSGFGALGDDGAAGVRGKRATGVGTALSTALLFDVAGAVPEAIAGEAKEQTQSDAIATLLASISGGATQNVGDQFLSELLARGTRFKIRPGTRLNVQVERDLVLPEYRGKAALSAQSAQAIQGRQSLQSGQFGQAGRGGGSGIRGVAR